MVRRTASLALGALVLVGVVAGCAPSANETATPTTGKTTTSSAGDDEAAVRARFLEYVSLSNDVDYADPDTFEPVYGVVTGTLLDYERESMEDFHSQGWSVTGATGVTALGDVVIDDAMNATLTACVDTAELKYFDADGNHRTVVDGTPLNTVIVSLILDSQEAEWLVSGYSIVEGGKGTCLLP